MKNDRNWPFHKNCVGFCVIKYLYRCKNNLNTFFPGISPRSAAHQSRPVNDSNVGPNIVCSDTFIECTERHHKKEVTNAQPALSMALVNVCPLNYYVTAQHQWVCHGQDSMRGAHIYLARKQMDGGSEHTPLTTETTKLKRFPQRAETTCPQALQRTSSTHLWRFIMLTCWVMLSAIECRE